MAVKGNKNKKRMHFGAVFPSPDNTHKYDLLTSIAKYSEEHDIHLTAYFGSYVTSNYDFATHFEPCFEAIRLNDSLDGIIVFSGFIAHNVGYDKFINYIEAIPKERPVVSIGLQMPNVWSVLVDNTSGMYIAVDHLIKEHGKRQIAFVKGPDDHPEAKARLLGYQKALADNGIEFDKRLLLPGDFTPHCGKSAVVTLMDELMIPFDAIANCNDEAAFGVLRELRERKVSVPDQVAVIGYDDVEEAARTVPSLSTIRQEFGRLGIVAADMLFDIISGKHTDKEKYVTPVLIPRLSCGCKDKRKKSKYIHETNSEKLLLRRVADNLVLLFDIDALSDELYRSLPQLSIDTALIGLYNSPVTSDDPDSNRTIDTLVGFDGDERFNIKNNNWNPILFSDYTTINSFDFDRKRRTLFFLPLFFADEEAGIAILSFDEKNPVESYETLKRNISTAVRGARLLSQIQMLSVTDELTGLLNRRGLFQFVHARILHLGREKEMIPVVLLMDMDGLKLINDTYGHTVGDQAIRIFAKILKSAMRESDIIGRIGGDEFVAFSLIKSEENVENLVSRIRDKFDEYNAKNLHPYSISGSFGAVMLEKATRESFGHAIESADDVLYKEKAEKRKKGLTR